MADAVLTNLPQGEELHHLIVEGRLRQSAWVQALLPAPRPRDPGYATRIATAESYVRAQYIKLMAVEPGKEDQAAEARIQLRQW